MSKSHLVSGCILASFILAFGAQTGSTQESEPDIQVFVNMVQLNVAVTDNKGNYITHLPPEDFEIREDGIPEKLATFEEGDEPTRRVFDSALNGGGNADPSVGTARSKAPRELPNSASASELSALVAGSNVFILFDTSNYMYRGFVYASDAIADFIRGLDRADSVAVYTYSRNLNRAVPLDRDRITAIAGLRKAVAGDDSALYNCLLLTLRDAARVPGRKVVIVFSNGPDNASMVAPDDVRAVAEDEGIPIYVISTSEVNNDPISSSIFRRISTNTGGKSYFAKTWQKQVEAFESIREDLGNSYTVTYYPQPNPNEGFRRIKIELTPQAMRKYKIRARPGYRPQRGF